MDGKGWLIQGLQNYQKTLVEQKGAILLFGDSSNSLLRLSAWHIVTGNLFPNPDMLQKNQQKGTKYISIQHSPSNPNMCVLFGQVFWSQHHDIHNIPRGPNHKQRPRRVEVPRIWVIRFIWRSSSCLLGTSWPWNLLNICRYIYLHIYTDLNICICLVVSLYQVASPPFLNETNHNPKCYQILGCT